MAINRYRMYVGPLGELRPLPPFPQGSNPEASPLVLGGVHQSLSGRITHDRVKTKRRWALAWDRLSEDDLLFIEAIHQCSVGSPLFLIDGRRTNVLPQDQAATGNVFRSTSSFVANAGILALANADAVKPAAFLGVLDSHLTWTGVVNTNTLKAAVTNNALVTTLPVLAGSSYTFSAYIAGNTTCRLTAFPFNTAGAAQTAVTSSNLTLTAGYQRFSFVYTPVAAETQVQFGLTATGSGNIQTMGWQAEIDNTLSEWKFGFGCPSVVSGSSPSLSYPRFGYYQYGLELLEV